VKSAQQVEQKKGMLESPTGSLQKEQEVGRIKSRMRLKKRIAPRIFKQQYSNVKIPKSQIPDRLALEI
jgi:hypothetical protein